MCVACTNEREYLESTKHLMDPKQYQEIKKALDPKKCIKSVKDVKGMY